MNLFNYNGKLFKSGTAVIGPATRGLRYGDGVFETMRSAKGQLAMPDEHFARLWKGMNALHFDIPAHFSPAGLTDEILKLVEKNRHTEAARLRLTVFRGEGGLYDPVNHFPNYFIESWELPAGNGAGDGKSMNSNGLVLDIYRDAKKSCDILSNLKHNNFLPYTMAALYAKEQKCNDAIVLNSFGRVCDTTIANIFIIKQGRLFTPSLAEGCVAGITRKELIRQLNTIDLQVTEGELTVSDLLEADELFLTNSIQGIRWVQRIGETEYGNELTAKIYSSLIATIC